MRLCAAADTMNMKRHKAEYLVSSDAMCQFVCMTLPVIRAYGTYYVTLAVNCLSIPYYLYFLHYNYWVSLFKDFLILSNRRFKFV